MLSDTVLQVWGIFCPDVVHLETTGFIYQFNLQVRTEKALSNLQVWNVDKDMVSNLILDLASEPVSRRPEVPTDEFVVVLMENLNY